MNSTTAHPKVGWAILATGSIARQFAGGLRNSQTGELVSVGSRTLESAEKFTKEFGGIPYASYAEAIADPKVHAVYIALPHHMHSEWTKKVALAGKAILCEKPFTLSLPEAEDALKVVKETGVLFMEAFMYRCHPQTQKVLSLIKEGVIGEPQMVNAEFGFKGPDVWDNFRAVNALGGGGLMDVGCYCVNFSRLIFGTEPIRLEYSARIGKAGYDETGVGILEFPNGKSAHFGTAVHLTLRNEAIIHGTTGHIEIEDPWKARAGSRIRVYKPGERDPYQEFDFSSTNDELYRHESDTFAGFYNSIASAELNIADTLGNMAALDALRKSAGLFFGEEKI